MPHRMLVRNAEITNVMDPTMTATKPKITTMDARVDTTAIKYSLDFPYRKQGPGEFSKLSKLGPAVAQSQSGAELVGLRIGPEGGRVDLGTVGANQ